MRRSRNLCLYCPCQRLQQPLTTTFPSLSRYFLLCMLPALSEDRNGHFLYMHISLDIEWHFENSLTKNRNETTSRLTLELTCNHLNLSATTRSREQMFQSLISLLFTPYSRLSLIHDGGQHYVGRNPSSARRILMTIRRMLQTLRVRQERMGN